jgi:hypothetical protein
VDPRLIVSVCPQHTTRLSVMSNTSADLFEDKRYAPRLNEHARHIFNGKQGIEIGDEE